MASRALKLPSSGELRISRSGDFIVAVDRNVAVADMQSRGRLHSSHPLSHPSHADFSADDRQLVVKSTWGEIALRDTQSGEKLASFRPNHQDEGTSIFFAPDGNSKVDGAWSGEIRVRHILDLLAVKSFAFAAQAFVRRSSQTLNYMRSLANQVTLREITAETVRAVTKLSVTEHQNRFVAPNAVSLAQALFSPAAWYRAIYLGEEPVGFVMLEDESLLAPMPENPTVGVWRFMVDARHQRQGVGRAAMLLVIEHVRSKRRFKKLAISYVPGQGSPESLYLSLGFVPTGLMDEDEVVMELMLDASAV